MKILLPFTCRRRTISSAARRYETSLPIHESRRAFDGSMRARAQLDNGESFSWFCVYQGLKRRFVSPPLLFNVSASAVDVVLPCFAANNSIRSHLVCPDDASDYEDDDTTFVLSRK